jgi:hypothetical protein
MGKDRQTSRELLRKQRDEELAHNRPFPLITLAEWRARERRATIPLIGSMFVILPLYLIPIALSYHLTMTTGGSWWLAILMPPTAILYFLVGRYVLPFVPRRYGLRCPYCPCAFVHYHNRSAIERNRPYEDRGRCPRCQRMIFTDWAKEEGWNKVNSKARGSGE